MIAARLAGGNLFFAFFGVGDFGSSRSSSEHSDDFSGGWGVFWIVSVGKN